MNLRTPSNARTALTVAIFAALAGQTQPIGAQVASAEELQGLWHASQYFPAEIHGTLLLLREKGAVVADVAGYRVPVKVSEERMSFRLPGSRGEFRGMKVNGEREIRGFWLQPVAPGPGRAFATNVTLRPFGREGWSGKLEPLNDSATFFLPITSASDPTIRTYLRDPERNRGVFTNVHRVTRAGDVVRLLGVRRGEKAETVLFEGLYKNGRLVFPSFDNGKSYDFEKVLDESTITFFPRGNPAPRYRYTQPVALNDGWPVATLEQVGISQPAIEKFVQMLIDAPMESVNTPQIHGVLIARHGKLVLEEYFHG